MAGLSEEVRDRLIAMADAGEMVWQQVAAITLDLLAQPGAQKMRIYSDVGACLGMKSAGVRAWAGTYQAVGDELLSEFPQFRYTHWRVLVPTARKQNKGLADLVMEWATTADEYNGTPVSPDTLAAKLGNPKDERPPLVKALDRAGAAVLSATRHAPDGMRAKLEELSTTLEALAKEAAEATEAEKA